MLGSYQQEVDDAVVVEVVTMVVVVELVEFPVDKVVVVFEEVVVEVVELVASGSGAGVVDVVGCETVREVFDSAAGILYVAGGVAASVIIEVVSVVRDDESVDKVELVAVELTV